MLNRLIHSKYGMKKYYMKIVNINLPRSGNITATEFLAASSNATLSVDEDTNPESLEVGTF